METEAPPSYAGTYDAVRLAETRMTDLLQLSVQTRWTRRDASDPADRYDEDVRIVRSRIAHELARRNNLRRRHPAPLPGTTITITEEPVDWPFPACEVAPRPGTEGTVVAYQAAPVASRHRIREDRIARRFYVMVRMGNGFDHAPGSVLPVPVWQVRPSAGRHNAQAA